MNGNNEATILTRLRRTPTMPIPAEFYPITFPAGAFIAMADAVYTDGSLTTQGSTYQRLTGKTITRGGAALVGHLPQDEYVQIHITATPNLHTSASTLELLAQQLALALTPPYTPIYTDYAPGIAIRREPRRCATGSLCDLTSFPLAGRLTKVTAHPERRTPAEHFTAHETGIYLADKAATTPAVAEDDMTTWRAAYRFTDIQVLRYLATLRPISLLDMSYLGIPITTLDHRFQEVRLKAYTLRRDRYRGDRGEPPCWTAATTTYGSALWRLSTSLSRRAQITRIAWDKHWTGRHRGFHPRQTPTLSSQQCELCHQLVEDQRHILLYCDHPQMRAVRARHTAHIQNAVLTCRIHHPALAPALEALMAVAQHHPHGQGVWTGMLQMQTQTVLAQQPELQGPCTAQQFTTLVAYMRLAAAAALDLYSTRTRLIDELTGRRNPWNYHLTVNAPHHISSILAREAVIGIESTTYLDAEGVPLGRTAPLTRPKRYRTPEPLSADNSEAIRQGHCLRGIRRRRADTTAPAAPHQSHVHTDQIRSAQNRQPPPRSRQTTIRRWIQPTPTHATTITDTTLATTQGGCKRSVGSVISSQSSPTRQKRWRGLTTDRPGPSQYQLTTTTGNTLASDQGGRKRGAVTDIYSQSSPTRQRRRRDLTTDRLGPSNQQLPMCTRDVDTPSTRRATPPREGVG
jgi:hypothetical protein